MNIHTSICTKSLMEQYLQPAIQIETETSKQLGILYGIPWQQDNFLSDRPGKWEYSSMAFVDGALVGYLIMSQWKNNIHGHRMAMSDLSGRMKVKVAQALYQQTHEAAIASGIASVTAIVPETNGPTCKYYFNEGFEQLKGDSLVSFIEGREMEAHVESDILVDNVPVANEPDRSFVFRFCYQDK